MVKTLSLNGAFGIIIYEKVKVNYREDLTISEKKKMNWYAIKLDKNLFVKSGVLLLFTFLSTLMLSS